MLQETEIEDDCRPDKYFEDQQELSLREKVGLTCLVNELGDFLHRGMDRQILECSVNE